MVIIGHRLCRCKFEKYSVFYFCLFCTNVKLRETATESRTSNAYPENLEPSDTMRLSQIIFIITLSIINIGGIDRNGHDLGLEDQ